ncbi:glycoside hydrolase family 31 protein [Amanita muscaria Koide BX008]|uniref:Glycoside hydrolase family 31 protein n=1 Tax=Amanita muscaria (strain Koide BX008) TaxID=946122 RepID=A0A0C2VZ43_AMAMK|nr:glycoside hydrolase family 31 protein [Amanita muscaria Koide BX008]
MRHLSHLANGLDGREYFNSRYSKSRSWAQTHADSVPIHVTDQNTDEELCNRWMQLSAFVPFYRNHNIMGALSQEPCGWESVADASRYT